MIPDARLQEILEGKDAERALEWVQAHGYVEAWAIVNNEALIIFDREDPPDWLKPILEAQDEDGNLSEGVVQRLAEALQGHPLG